ncbi:MAG: nucleoside hydrolase [Phycisphaerae bacterium]|nr:nucleoside hydrolase [Phycisphaerae bacterium]
MRLALPLAFMLCLPAPPLARVRIIFDTDMDTDCDDAGGLAVLHALADRGEAEILATVVSSRFPWSAPCVEAINRYYGRAGLPIGAPKTAWADTGGRGSRYARQIAERFPTRLRSNDDAPDAVEVYRRVLAAQDDGAVVIVTVGYLTNLRDLLASTPDAISPLDGRALVQRKAARWVCMGGRYPEHLDPAVFGNFKPDPSSAVIAIRDWPGPIYFSGLGDDIHTGSRLKETPADNPVRRAYELYLGRKKTRASWDPICVLFAVRDKADFWKVHTGGHNHIFKNGTNQWRDGPATNHRLVQLRRDWATRLRDTLDALMVQAPRADQSD